jgi:hypothetical protein
VTLHNQFFFPANPYSTEEVFFIVENIFSIRNNTSPHLISLILLHSSFNQTNKTNLKPFNYTHNFLLLRGVIQTPNIPNKKISLGGRKTSHQDLFLFTHFTFLFNFCTLLTQSKFNTILKRRKNF